MFFGKIYSLFAYFRFVFLKFTSSATVWFVFLEAEVYWKAEFVLDLNQSFIFLIRFCEILLNRLSAALPELVFVNFLEDTDKPVETGLLIVYFIDNYY